jgi:parvulin-like peptidyl-prolyl isomerase
MKRWLKEPLLHFLLAGGLLFAGYGLINRGVGDGPRVVRISAAEVDWLKETWTRQWQRPPSEQELRGLVTGYLKEELLAREAKEIGLEENDTIVRRRLAQKMEFLVQDTARFAEPGENELRRLYDAGRARYQTPALISFTQIYFRTEAAARRGLEDLVKRNPSEVGDRSLLERDHAGVDGQAVTSLFGGEFAEKVFALETGKWQGPVPSGYGYHLVFVRERQSAQLLPFDEVRAQVQEEWHRLQQAKAGEQFFAGLLKKYDVVVEESIKPLIGPLAEVTR